MTFKDKDKKIKNYLDKNNNIYEVIRITENYIDSFFNIFLKFNPKKSRRNFNDKDILELIIYKRNTKADKTIFFQF